MQPLCTWEGAYCHKITGHKITLRKFLRKLCETFENRNPAVVPLQRH